MEYSKEVKKRCEDLFTKYNMSLRLISEEEEVPFGTVKDWHKHERWSIKRRVEAAKLVFEIRHQGELICKKQLKCARFITDVTYRYMTGQPAPDDPDMDIVEHAAKVLEKSSGIVKKTIPDFDDEMLQRLLDAIEYQDGEDEPS